MTRAPLAFACLAILLPAAQPAAAFDGAVQAHGLGRIEVTDAASGAVLCVDDAVVSVALAFDEVEAGGQEAPTGYYASASLCASFAYPIRVAYDCTGGVGQAVRCEEDGPPRWFTLDPFGNFHYVRDNLGIHFEVWGWLHRSDAAP